MRIRDTVSQFELVGEEIETPLPLRDNAQLPGGKTPRA